MNGCCDHWELVLEVDGRDHVRRLSVPGGWLYQVATAVHVVRGNAQNTYASWHPPVFVPDLAPEGSR